VGSDRVEPATGDTAVNLAFAEVGRAPCPAQRVVDLQRRRYLELSAQGRPDGQEVLGGGDVVKPEYVCAGVDAGSDGLDRRGR